MALNAFAEGAKKYAKQTNPKTDDIVANKVSLLPSI
jgi:hypothetical protein